MSTTSEGGHQDMTINRYIELLDGLLVRSGHAGTNYATANHYYLAGATIAVACTAVVSSRN